VKSLLLLAVLAVGCGFPRPSESYTCSTNADCKDDNRICQSGFCVVGEIDAAVEEDASACSIFSARHFDACMIAAPGGDLMLDQSGTYTYDTDTAMLAPPSGPATMPPAEITPSGRLISVHSLTVAAGTTLRVVGTRPLLVASWSTISVSGSIDASSNVNGAGAGANPPECSTHAAGAGTGDTGGGGGGGGGGFHGAGGAGGIGSSGVGLAGTGGTPVAVPPLSGGCKGGSGGTGDVPGGVGGNGGGAIQLTAKDSITVGGTIHAGGAGGEPGMVITAQGDSGGGGGGSGGMIGLEAPSITLLLTSTLAANGGGGGEGVNTTTGGTQRGADGSAFAMQSAGGAGTDGGDGGLGSGGAVLTGGPGDSDSDGAGGGGGGAGYIAIKTASLTAGSGTESPAHTVVQ